VTVRRVVVVTDNELRAYRTADAFLPTPRDLEPQRLDAPDAPMARPSAYLGSPGALGALGLHRRDLVTTRGLAFAMQGRSAWDGEQIRRPGAIAPEVAELAGGEGDGGRSRPAVLNALTSYDLTLETPLETADAWSRGDPARRAEIEAAMLASADTLLEEIRQTANLVPRRRSDGTVGVEPARGLAASAIVEGLPELTMDEQVLRAQLRVHVLLLGVERADGALVTPVGRYLQEAEPAAAKVALEGLARATRGLSATPSAARDPAPEPAPSARSEDPESHSVEHLRLLLGDDNAARVDELAELYVGRYADAPDATLTDRRTELAAPLDSLPAHAATALDFARRLEANAVELSRAQEDRLVLETRASELGCHPHLLSALELAREHEEAVEAHGNAVLEEANEPNAFSLDGWVDDYGQQVAEDIGIARLQARRQQERAAPGLDDARLAAGNVELETPERQARSAGDGEVSEILDAWRADRHAWREEVQRPGAAIRIERGDVSAPSALDELGGVIGRGRAEALAQRNVPLAQWVQEQPDAWIESRLSELGAADQRLDRDAGRRTASLEAARETVERELRRAEVEGARLEADAEGLKDVGRRRAMVDAAEVQYRNADEYGAQLERLDEQLERLPAKGDYLKDWTIRDGDRAALSSLYHDERAYRRERDILQAVERSVVDPPAQLQDLIGPAPDRLAAQYDEWVSVARGVEQRRLGSRSATREADGGEARQARVLDQRVARLRETQGMEARAHEPARDAGPQIQEIGR